MADTLSDGATSTRPRGSTRVTVVVLALTESFAHEWRSLAPAAIADVHVVRVVDEIPLTGELRAVIVAAGGGEEQLDQIVTRVRSTRGTEVVAVGASTDYRVAASAIRHGATEYFALPGDWAALREWVMARVDRDAVTDEHRAHPSLRGDFSAIKGRSPSLLSAIERAAKVVKRDSTVLITGETGTGKEILARAIHDNGSRAARPFLDVNCAAIPAPLLEAELFGYERGAFTDAKQAKPGLFEAADQGTLFLDEIGDLSLELQAKLLKVLESRRVRRLGALRDRDVDVRIIAATNADLLEAARSGRFRMDLYYRLGVVPIHLPPLRDRGEDILLLAEHFLSRFSAQYSIQPPTLSVTARRALLAHSWPGNVRELRNVIERAIVLDNGVVKPEFLGADVRELTTCEPLSLPFPAPLKTIERAAARATVERLQGNKTAAASVLGVSRKYLYALLEESGGEPRSGARAEPHMRVVR